MIIGTVRPEEARVFDSEAGYHQFTSEDGEPHGSFEVFWHNGDDSEDDSMAFAPGWYWWACFPGCQPDSDAASGPFASSSQARQDADEFWEG
jgi:hypothetical protein